MANSILTVKPGPDRRSEKVVGYYSYVADLFAKRFGRRPSRTTMFKYLSRGYPVARGGPYIEVPIFLELKRPMTTVQAMQRFMGAVRRLEGVRDPHGAAERMIAQHELVQSPR